MTESDLPVLQVVCKDVRIFDLQQAFATDTDFTPSNMNRFLAFSDLHCNAWTFHQMPIVFEVALEWPTARALLFGSRDSCSSLAGPDESQLLNPTSTSTHGRNQQQNTNGQSGWLWDRGE